MADLTSIVSVAASLACLAWSGPSVISTDDQDSATGAWLVASPADSWPGCPAPPLYRNDPRGYTVGLSIDIGATSQTSGVPDPFISAGGSITIEAATVDTSTVSDLRGLESSVRLNGIPQVDPPRIEGDPLSGSQRIRLDIPPGALQTISARATWPAIAFSIGVDEPMAAKITWPREWTAEVAKFLTPSQSIESDHEVFKAFVAKTTEGRLRRTPIYLAAKDLVRRTIVEFQNIDSQTLAREGQGTIRGFRLQGALSSTSALSVTPGDMVCTCVAVLRAAGIPARPVIGIYSGSGNNPDTKLPKDRTTLCVWAEFNLPGAGWVPFDPYEMRGRGLPQANVNQPWKWFGTIKQMNRRVVLAYDFAPFNHGVIQNWPAGWAWTVSGRTTAPFRIVDATAPLMVSRGQIRP
ncbi:MAG: transglutaminase-like domain-containing protein [Planctomycetota bacterium]|nr:transglutaminase-like domain-containing protein [Planctomycetota bacterium]MDA1025791.1 transglutaminase-like domain-containing protein [Planctomycetota bacterium]